MNWDEIARAYARAEDLVGYEVKPVAAYCWTRNDYLSVFKGCNPEAYGGCFQALLAFRGARHHI